MQPVGRFTIASAHPSLAGHFQGHPIVPGVVLLEEALACLPAGLTLLTAKFTAPVEPEDVVDVASATRTDGRIAFACTVAGRPVLHGTAGAAE